MRYKIPDYMMDTVLIKAAHQRARRDCSIRCTEMSASCINDCDKNIDCDYRKIFFAWLHGYFEAIELGV